MFRRSFSEEGRLEMMGGFMALAELRRLADEPQPDMVLLKTDAGSRRPTRLPFREIYLHRRGL